MNTKNQREYMLQRQILSLKNIANETYAKSWMYCLIAIFEACIILGLLTAILTEG